jgi:hypothetical protein
MLQEETGRMSERGDRGERDAGIAIGEYVLEHGNLRAIVVAIPGPRIGQRGREHPIAS